MAVVTESYDSGRLLRQLMYFVEYCKRAGGWLHPVFSCAVRSCHRWYVECTRVHRIDNDCNRVLKLTLLSCSPTQIHNLQLGWPV